MFYCYMQIGLYLLVVIVLQFVYVCMGFGICILVVFVFDFDVVFVVSKFIIYCENGGVFVLWVYDEVVVGVVFFGGVLLCLVVVDCCVVYGICVFVVVQFGGMQKCCYVGMFVVVVGLCCYGVCCDVDFWIVVGWKLCFYDMVGYCLDCVLVVVVMDIVDDIVVVM